MLGNGAFGGSQLDWWGGRMVLDRIYGARVFVVVVGVGVGVAIVVVVCCRTDKPRCKCLKSFGGVLQMIECTTTV